MKIHTQIFLAMLLGIVSGLVFREQIEAISFIGTIFIKLIKMIIVPLIVTSLILGIVSLGNISELGKIGIKTFVLYLGTTLIAIIIGLILANIIHPGVGAHLGAPIKTQSLPTVDIKDTLMGMLPENPLKAMVEVDIVPVIVFALIFGLALTAIGKQATGPLINILEIIYAATLKITDWVMKLAPYGVFALMAVIVGTSGPDIFVSLGKYIFVVLSGLILQVFIVYLFLLVVIAKVNPFKFFNAILEAIMVAFSTASSSATLPISMFCLEKNMGISNRITGFVLPLGATMNMDGTALYEAAAALFIAQAYGITLGLDQQILIVITACLASIGAAGIPSAGLVTMTMVLSAVGLPLEGIGMILAVDRILDMCRTSINVIGDTVIATVIAKSEKIT